MPRTRKYAARKPVATKKVDISQDKEIAKIKKTIKSIEPELKVDHAIYGALNFDQSLPRIQCLNALAKGLNVDNRTGNKVRAKRLELAFQVYANATLLHDTIVRIMVVKEKTTLGSDLSLSQLLGSATPLTYALTNYQTRDPSRYSILRDITIGIGPVSHAAAVGTVPLPQYPSIRDYKTEIPLNLIVDYARGNAGTVADIETNGIFIVFITDVTTLNCLAVRGEWNYIYMDA